MARVRPRPDIVLLGLTLLTLTATFPVAPIAADSPGRAHAEVVAQGVATLPAGPVIWRIGRETVSPDEAGVAAPDASTSVCVPILAGTGAPIDSESEGVLLTLDQATGNGDGSYTWGDLPFGIYAVTDVVLPPDYEGLDPINRDSPDPVPGQSLVRLSEHEPSAHFTVFGLGGLRD
jgi:hypothetical protein